MNTLNVYESVSENCSSSWSFDHFYLNWNLESISWYANEYMKIHMKCWGHCATVYSALLASLFLVWICFICTLTTRAYSIHFCRKKHGGQLPHFKISKDNWDKSKVIYHKIDQYSFLITYQYFYLGVRLSVYVAVSIKNRFWPYKFA